MLVVFGFCHAIDLWKSSRLTAKVEIAVGAKWMNGNLVIGVSLCSSWSSI